MPASPEMLAARRTLEPLLPGFDVVTGIDIGFADEEARDPDNLAVRIFVSDSSAVPQELTDAIAAAGAPVVIIQRTFEPGGAVDSSMHRPVVGGVSVGAARFVATGDFPVGTLGAIGRTTGTDPSIVIGLSNHHVLAHDANRAVGDNIIQPEPTPFGELPNDTIGTLLSWEFPEIVYSGIADAAICSVNVPVQGDIADLGAVAGTAAPSIGMLVTKRGRTTGVTHGIVTTDDSDALLGTYFLPYPHLPPVNNPDTGVPTVRRQLTGQVQVMIDFPQSIVWSDSGDSGSVVLDTDNAIVGLHFAHGFASDGEPIAFGLMTPISVVVQALGLTFTQAS
jgi:hypothetical protein